MMTDRLHILPKHRTILESLLEKHLPDVEVWAYGSRVNGRSHDGSDLDLVLRGPNLEKIPENRLSEFQEAIRESKIPFLIEARDWARLPERFHTEIKRDNVALIPTDSASLRDGEMQGHSAASKRGDQFACQVGATTGVSETAPPYDLRYTDEGPILDDVADLLSGGTPRKSNPDYWNGPIPWLTPKDMGQWSGSTNKNVTNEAIGNGTRLAPRQTIFIAVRGMSLHKEIRIFRPDEVMSFNQDIKAVIPKKDIDPLYLYYILVFKKPELLGAVEAAGHGTGRLPTDKLKELVIPRFSPHTEKALADFLVSLDDKIELNHRMNDTLEKIAQAIFRDWFVDFGPTRAKAEGLSPYLTPILWNLFPDTFNIEGVPNEWRLRTISKCFCLAMGQSPSGNTYNDDGEGLPFFQGRTDFGFRYPTTRRYCNAPTRIAERDDTLVSVRAPVGDVNMAWQRCCIGRGVSALRHKSGARSFTYYSAWAIQKELKQYEHTGTVFGAINKKQFEALNVVEPTPKIIALFEKIVGPLDDLIRKNVSEIRTLSQTRDLLLPKLMSGEIRLTQAEKIVEEAV